MLIAHSLLKAKTTLNVTARRNHSLWVRLPLPPQQLKYSMIKLLIVLTLSSYNATQFESSHDADELNTVMPCAITYSSVMPRIHYHQLETKEQLMVESIPKWLIGYKSVLLQYFVPFGITFFI